MVGTGLTLATAGQSSTFAVLLLDTFSVGNPQRSDCSRFLAISSNFGLKDEVFAQSNSQWCQNGTYIVSYVVTKSGKFTLSLLSLQGLCIFL
jgi:hypothetical protein